MSNVQRSTFQDLFTGAFISYVNIYISLYAPSPNSTSKEIFDKVEESVKSFPSLEDISARFH